MTSALTRASSHVSLRVLGQGLEFIGWAMLARRLGAQSFGALAIPFAVARYGGLVADWGASVCGPRDVARAAGQPATAAIRRRQVLGLLVTAVGAVLMVAAGQPHLVPLVLVAFARGFNRDWIALGRQQMVRASLPTVVQGCALVAGAAFATSAAGGAAAVGSAYLLGVVVSLSLNRMHGRSADLTGRLAVPWILVATLANQLLLELDVVLLGVLASTKEAGIYAAVYRIPNALNTVLALVLLTALPSVTRAVGDSHGRFVMELERARRLAAFSGILAALVLVIPAAAAVEVAFGPGFETGSTAAAILTMGVCVAVMAAPLHPLYLARGSDRTYGLVLAAVAGANFVLNLVLIPALGMHGAAVATLASQCALYVALQFMTRSLAIGP